MLSLPKLGADLLARLHKAEAEAEGVRVALGEWHVARVLCQQAVSYGTGSGETGYWRRRDGFSYGNMDCDT